ncbi:MAG: hypothetical protein K9L56_14260 [Clostridiales bacterium]|nr:hypothetical protein [Clostridiales bacterium]
MPLVHNGEEYCLKYIYDDAVVKPTSVTVGLFLNDPNDGGVDLGLTSSISDVDVTEPDNSLTYARQTISFNDVDFTTVFDSDLNHWKAIFEDMSFDVSNNTENIDAFFVAWDIDDDSTIELVGYEQFDNLYDLSTINGNFVLAEAGQTLEPAV